MRKDLDVSIVMAVYNGAKFLKEQLESILVQLSATDELIISYDNSNDNSLDILNDFDKDWEQIKLVINDHPGVVKNFENGLRYVTKDLVMYCDQDDYWLPHKLDRVRKEFESDEITVVIHDAALTDEELNITHASTFAIRNGNASIVRNLIRLSYIGCSLTFRAYLIPVVVPIPTSKRSHDWWTGTICSAFGRMSLIDESLILHRMHANNVTPKKRPGLIEQLNIRILIATQALKRYLKFRKKIDKTSKSRL